MSAFLAVLLTVLKIIGLILLGILAFVLALLLVVLFVPIRYKADGFYKDKDYNVKGKANWLLYAVTVSFDLKASKDPVIKILGIKLKGKKKKGSEEKTGEDSSDPETKEASLDDTDEESKDLKERNDEDTTDKVTDVSLTDSSERSEENTAKSEDEKSSEKKRKNADDKKEFKSESVYDKIKRYIEIIKSEDFKESFSLVKKQLCRLLKAVLPRKWEINASLGFEDPSLTGYVCALSGAMYMWFRKHIHIVGDFDNEEISADAYFKGRIYIVVLVYVFIRVWFNKKIRHTIDLFR
jgi:hypothetical protein